MICDFCNDSIKDRILYETNNYIVFTTLGAFVPGYLLIIPKIHTIAFCNLPKKLLEEFQDLLEKTRNIIESKYGDTIIFEHGESGGSVPHAHMHIIPINNIDEIILKESHLVKINCITYLSEISPPYLFYGNSKREYYLIQHKNGDIPSQYLRQLSCQSIAHNDWNWKIHGNQDNINRTKEDLIETFNSLKGENIHE